jgi:hypothetical protein
LTSGWARLDDTGRVAFAGGVALAVLAIAGSIVGAWTLRGFGLVVLLAAIAVALVAWIAASGGGTARERRWPVAAPWLELGGALAAASLALLNVLELAADLDDLEDWGGPVGALLSLALAAVALVVLAAVARRAGVLSIGAWASPRPVRFAAIGGALVLGAVALGLLLGDRALGQTTAFNVAFVLLAVVAVRAAVDPGGVHLPFPAGWLAAGLVILAAIFAVGLLTTLAGSRVGAADWLFFAIHLVGLATVAWAALLLVRPEASAAS